MKKGFYGGFEQFSAAKVNTWNIIAKNQTKRGIFSRHYSALLKRFYSFIIPPHSKVLEIGCGDGSLLASLKPSLGVGIDFSAEMVKKAQANYPNLAFIKVDAHDFQMSEKFDYIFLSDLINELWDLQAVLENIHKVSHRSTRIIVNFHSQLWQFPLELAKKLNLATPTRLENWFTVSDVVNLMEQSKLKPVKFYSEFIIPINIPGISTIANKYLAKLLPFKWFALSNFIIARPIIYPTTNESPSVSIIVPARNEAGNIKEIITRIPEMGGGTEIIFVEGHSSDDTWEAINAAIKENPNRNCRVIKQKGIGKGGAVRDAFNIASGEIFMICDADMTMPPEDLIRFYRILVSGECELANGVRLVYRQEKDAMQFFNLVGNKFFSSAFSWLLGQPIRDTLCGTKALWAQDYWKINANRSYFGDFDPFGDFDLLFGAAMLNLKIVDIPIRYQSRSYGSTNIQRWRHGWILLKMVAFASTKIKFI